MSFDDATGPRLGALIERAIAVGATPGRPATPERISTAESRLGVRFDSDYRALMLACNGIEGIRHADNNIVPVDELGIPPQWSSSAHQLDFEYFGCRSSIRRSSNLTSRQGPLSHSSIPHHRGAHMS
jgi:hypothetical protein